jgi:hypothetical protein
MVLFLILLSYFSRAEGGGSQSRGNVFNPDIAANMLFLYRNGNRGNDVSSAEPNGYSLQEAEIQLTSDVDVYARATALFSIEKDPTTGEYGIDPEEVFTESLNLPYVTVRAGKFKAALGKYNTYHSHALPFIDPSLINTALLGDEGLNDAGVGVAGLLPTPWFSELTVQSIGAGSDGFQNSSPNGLVTVARYRNLWDVNDDSTLEWGLSGAQGPNVGDRQTRIWGTDLTFKWRPAMGGKYHAFIWSTEYLNGLEELALGGQKITQGGATFAQWQFDERWWLQGRAEYMDGRDDSNPVLTLQKKESVLVAFVPTEFSELRAQYDHLEDNTGKDPENRVTLQLNISIGAHPAHAY